MTPYDIIKTVKITEKGTDLSEANNQYVLVADRRANKIQIRKAVESLFNVKVLSVNTLSVRGKIRRKRTAAQGRDPSWKKAIVTLKQGDAISLT
jgi:large subunit ribosomal protein L23